MRHSIAQLCFLSLHGIVLWALFPLGFLAWFLVAPYRAFSRRQYVGPMRLVSWLDLNQAPPWRESFCARSGARFRSHLGPKLNGLSTEPRSWTFGSVITGQERIRRPAQLRTGWLR